MIKWAAEHFLSPSRMWSLTGALFRWILCFIGKCLCRGSMNINRTHTYTNTHICTRHVCVPVSSWSTIHSGVESQRVSHPQRYCSAGQSKRALHVRRFWSPSERHVGEEKKCVCWGGGCRCSLLSCFQLLNRFLFSDFTYPWRRIIWSWFECFLWVTLSLDKTSEKLAQELILMQPLVILCLSLHFLLGFLLSFLFSLLKHLFLFLLNGGLNAMMLRRFLLVILDLFNICYDPWQKKSLLHLRATGWARVTPRIGSQIQKGWRSQGCRAEA